MSIKFRSVNTCKFNFISNLKTACTTHTCTIYHNRIHTYNSWNTKFLCKKTDKLHHDKWSYSNTKIVFLSFIIYKVFKYICTHTFSYITTIICCNIQITRNFTHWLFKNKHIFILCTYNNICIHTMLMKPFNLWIYRSCTYTTCYEYYLFLL